MAEDKKTFGNQRNPSESADAELQQILREVFGKKNNAHEKPSDTSNVTKSESNIKNTQKTSASRPVDSKRTDNQATRRPVNNQHRPRPENGQNRPIRKRPADGQAANRPRSANDLNKPNGQRPVNGQRPRPANGQRSANGQRPRPTNGQRPVRKPDSDARAVAASAEKKVQNAGNDKRNIDNHNTKKPMPQKHQNTLEKKISKLSGKKKAAVIAGIVLGVLLLLVIIVYGIYHFYYSLFGRYSGKANSGQYTYNSSDYTDDAHTMTPEEAEAALKKQLKGKASGLMKDQDVTNILLIGEDLRDTDSEERGNTDVMMLISLNQKNKTITMTSFLRDTWVNIDGYGTAKLNAAYWKDGPELLKKTIQDYYSISIDRYVIVNFKSFMTIVDAVGGIDMDVRDDEAEGMEAPMAEQNNLLGNPKGTDYLKKGGKNLHLNGNQALAFARLRYVGNADYERTERQRRVISEIISKAKSLSLVDINKLLQEVLPEIKIDLTEGEVASLLLNCFDYMSYSIQELRIPADDMFSEEIIGTDVGNLAVICPDFHENTRLLLKTIYGEKALEEYDSKTASETAQQENYADNYGQNYYGGY